MELMWCMMIPLVFDVLSQAKVVQFKMHLSSSFLPHLSSLITGEFTFISLPRKKIISSFLHIIHFVSGTETCSLSPNKYLTPLVDFVGFFGHLSCLFSGIFPACFAFFWFRLYTFFFYLYMYFCAVLVQLSHK